MSDSSKPKTEALPEQSAATRGCVVRVTDGPDVGTSRDLLSGSLTVGTDASCDLVLTDTSVSSTHLRIDATSAGLRVADLGSTNGTYYLGGRIQEISVGPGAVFVLGRTRIALGARAPDDIPLSTRTSYGSLIGSSVAMRQMYATLEKLESLDYPILLLGETGVGKELVAREIHAHSAKKDGPYEILDCGALASSVLESELFGHVAGAFTGANRNHAGVFERAHGGTVFMDEVGELPLELQPKLLRVLETGTVQPVGGSQRRAVDFRLIAATHRNLEAMTRDGTFREDLYFRLNVVPIHIPSLRERREDIPELVRHFVRGSAHPELELSRDTLELFTSGYDWPGNVRELYNAVLRTTALGRPPESVAPRGGETSSSRNEAFDVDPDEPLSQAKRRVVEAFEREYLVSQLERTEGNIGQAARLSEMDRAHFKRLLKRHGLLPPRE